MTFDEASATAARVPDMLSYLGWCDFLEQRYTVMPMWFWHETERRSRYVDYVERKLAELDRLITGGRADLRAQLVRYFCDWNHLPTTGNLSIEKLEHYQCPRGISDCQCGAEYCRRRR